MARTYTLIVLDDGETYSGIDGASILVVNETGMDEIIEMGDADAVSPKNVISCTVLGDANVLHERAQDYDE